MREAIVISRIRRVKTRPRLASVAAFLCLIVAHFECPDITIPLLSREISGGCTDAVAASDQSVFHDGRVIPQLSAEDYGEPQTRPAAPAGQNEDRWKFSTAEKGAEPAILGRARTEIEERRRLGTERGDGGGRYRLLV